MNRQTTGDRPEPRGATLATETSRRRPSIDDLLYLVRFNPDDRSHIVVKDNAICRDKCFYNGYSCTLFCPAQVYKWEGDHVSVAFEGCVECGACRIGCPHANIDWTYPRGGYGVSYKFG